MSGQQSCPYTEAMDLTVEQSALCVFDMFKAYQPEEDLGLLQ